MSRSTTQQLDTTPWSEAPVVFYLLPTCFHCGHHQFDGSKTVDNGDGTRTKKATCRRCGMRNKLVGELPETGNSPFGTC